MTAVSRQNVKSTAAQPLPTARFGWRRMSEFRCAVPTGFGRALTSITWSHQSTHDFRGGRDQLDLPAERVVSNIARRWAVTVAASIPLPWPAPRHPGIGGNMVLTGFGADWTWVRSPVLSEDRSTDNGPKRKNNAQHYGRPSHRVQRQRRAEGGNQSTAGWKTWLSQVSELAAEGATGVTGRR